MAKGDTHFGGLVYSMGVPTIGNGIPMTFGTYYFVDADNGSDGNSGTSMDRPLATILAAYNKMTTNKHDVCVLTGVGGHALADELLITKSKVHFVGLGLGSRYMGQRTRITLAASVATAGTLAAINNQGQGNTFTNLKITSASTVSSNIFAVAEQGEFSQWTNCWFEKNSDLDQAGAAEVLMVGDTPYFLRCTFGNGIYTVAAARQNWLMSRSSSETANVARDVIAEECIFMSRCNSTTFVNVRCTTNDVERLFEFINCTFVAVKTSPLTQALVFGVASALTDAQAILKNCAVQNISNVAANTAGVYTNSPTPVANATETVAVHTS